MRSKRPIHVDGLRGARAGRCRLTDPWRYVLKFENTSGPGAGNGREGVAVLTPAEIAMIVESIPVSALTDDNADEQAANWLAVRRVRDLFERQAQS